jgi:hypothetical protein
MAAQRDIVLRRNEDLAENFRMSAGGVPIDITGWTIELQVRDLLDNSTLIQSAEIDFTDALNGEFDIILKAGEGYALGEYGNPLWEYLLPYDLRATDTTGIRTDLIAGDLHLMRGVTQ